MAGLHRAGYPELHPGNWLICGPLICAATFSGGESSLTVEGGDRASFLIAAWINQVHAAFFLHDDRICLTDNRIYKILRTPEDQGIRAGEKIQA